VGKKRNNGQKHYSRQLTQGLLSETAAGGMRNEQGKKKQRRGGKNGGKKKKKGQVRAQRNANRRKTQEQKLPPK